jgi:single-stranded DNA-binding protein
VKGARVYVEGSLKLDKWTAADNTERTALSCMARLARLPQIDANRPKRDADGAPPTPAVNPRPARARDEMDSEIPFVD